MKGLLVVFLALWSFAAQAQFSNPVGPAISAVGQSGSATDLATGTLPTARMPALTGDCTSTVNTVALTCIPRLTPVAVSALPTCNTGNKGLMYLVTDALLPAALATVAGSGAVIVSVVCTGTAWIVQ